MSDVIYGLENDSTREAKDLFYQTKPTAALHDSRVPIRAAAARDLRLAPGPEIDEVLATVIASDSDPVVRADAIFAARFRRPLPPPIADALLHVATDDPVDHVRSEAVALLRQNPTASPSVPETLMRVAESWQQCQHPPAGEGSHHIDLPGDFAQAVTD